MTDAALMDKQRRLISMGELALTSPTNKTKKQKLIIPRGLHL